MKLNINIVIVKYCVLETHEPEKGIFQLYLLHNSNRPFSHCFCACVYRSRDALFLDNRRDFTKMGQTDFEPLTLSM